MADITKTKAVRDGSVEMTETGAAASQTIAADHNDETAYLVVRNTDASTAAVVTIKAGDGQRADIGDLTVTVAATKFFAVGPLDSMRFKNMANGKITVTVSGPSTLTNVKLAVIHQ